jgi:pimeloyl-ACP methyl ester carboxylesterase
MTEERWRKRDPVGLTYRQAPVGTGVTLNVVERPGQGTPVICLHGVWGWWRYWRPLVPGGPGSFAPRPLLMVDLRGHGGSSKPEHGYGWADYAADLAALVREAAYERVTFVGHSLGALTALLVAAQLPGRVESFVLEDPPLPLPRGPIERFRDVYELRSQPNEQIIDYFMAWHPGTTHEQADENAFCLQHTADGVFRAMLSGAMGDTDIPVPGVTIDAPALLIRAGNHELRVFNDSAEPDLRAVLPQLRVATIPGTSHTVLRDAPDVYRAVLADALGA